MFAVILGLIFIAFFICACLPSVLGWGSNILDVLKGAAPLLACFTGIISIFIGVADTKDKKEALKEEKEFSSESKEEV